jgi:phosphoglycolate phosphatase-like HAD superfamily hydrolase
MTTRTPCYIFDIDGTLADNSHRTHHLLKTPKDWDAYHANFKMDKPIKVMCQLARGLSAISPVICCTGRHEGQRDGTEWWLGRYADLFFHGLYMRKEGDHRPDHVIKLELLEQIRTDGYEPIMVFDDRNSVVKMWRDAGIPCAQVAEGNF